MPPVPLDGARRMLGDRWPYSPPRGQRGSGRSLGAVLPLRVGPTSYRGRPGTPLPSVSLWGDRAGRAPPVARRVDSTGGRLASPTRLARQVRALPLGPLRSLHHPRPNLGDLRRQDLPSHVRVVRSGPPWEAPLTGRPRRGTRSPLGEMLDGCPPGRQRVDSCRRRWGFPSRGPRRNGMRGVPAVPPGPTLSVIGRHARARGVTDDRLPTPHTTHARRWRRGALGLLRLMLLPLPAPPFPLLLLSGVLHAVLAITRGPVTRPGTPILAPFASPAAVHVDVARLGVPSAVPPAPHRVRAPVVTRWGGAGGRRPAPASTRTRSSGPLRARRVHRPAPHHPPPAARPPRPHPWGVRAAHARESPPAVGAPPHHPSRQERPHLQHLRPVARRAQARVAFPGRTGPPGHPILLRPGGRRCDGCSPPQHGQKH